MTSPSTPAVRRRLLPAAVVVANVAASFAGPAIVAAAQIHAVSISPTTATAGVATSSTVTVDNLSAAPGQTQLGCVRVAIPAGVTVSGTPTVVALDPRSRQARRAHGAPRPSCRARCRRSDGGCQPERHRHRRTRPGDLHGHRGGGRDRGLHHHGIRPDELLRPGLHAERLPAERDLHRGQRGTGPQRGRHPVAVCDPRGPGRQSGRQRLGLSRRAVARTSPMPTLGPSRAWPSRPRLYGESGVGVLHHQRRVAVQRRRGLDGLRSAARIERRESAALRPHRGLQRQRVDHVPRMGSDDRHERIDGQHRRMAARRPSARRPTARRSRSRPSTTP